MKRLTERLPRRLTNRTAAVGALALAVAVVGGFVLLSRGGDGDAEAQESGAPTAALERRSLAEEVSVDGTLGFGDESAVINRLSGTITWLPDPGAEIRRGQRIFEVDDEPVLLMYGTVPAYRELSTEVSDGPDVKQLEENLAELGFDAGGSMTVDSSYTSATSAAVSDWQDSLGLDETGSIELGRVIFQAGERRVSSVDVELGSSADSAAGASGAATDVSAQSQGSPETTVLAAYPATTAQVQEVAPAPTEEADPAEEPATQNGSGKPKSPSKSPSKDGNPGKDGSSGSGRQAQQPSDSMGSGAPSGASASSAADSAETEAASPSTQVMTTSSTKRAVTVQLDPEQVDLARRGDRVGVTLPDGDEVKGRISSIGTVAEATSTETDAAEGQATEDATIEVVVDLPGDSAAGALDEAPVTVDLTQEVQKDVFVVPVAALIGTSGGEYAILVSEGGVSREVAVEPGLFADGFVEVEGEALEEGLEVEVPEE